jgi:Mg2+ and Co2+ transporter CorA
LQLFSLIARADAKVSIELTETSKALTEANLAVAREAKDDSGAMKTISIMTMLFLPATYFAALFSMPTLQWGDASSVIRERFWIYWAFTIPTTCCVFLVWAVSTRMPMMRRPVQTHWQWRGKYGQA